MDLSNFSLLKEDDENLHVKHPSGKVLVLNKEMLSDKAKGLVKKMACGGMTKNYDEGGTVGKSWLSAFEDKAAEVGQKVNDTLGSGKVTQTYEAPDKTRGTVGSVKARNQNDRTYSGTSDYPNYDDGGQVQDLNQMAMLQPEAQPQQMMSVQPKAAPQPQAAQASNPMVQKGMDMDSLLKKQQQDIMDLEKAQMGSADEEAAAQKSYANSMSKLSTPNDMVADMHLKDEALKSAYLSGTIDPERYWHNKSTGSKISAGIGLALGGLGAGLTHGQNYAAQFINKAIDNDIDAQKNDQSKKMNLWRMNREAYGDDLKANIATSNQLYTGLQAKLASAAAKAAAPTAKYNAEKMINEIEQQKISNRQRMSLLSQGGNGSTSGTDPLLLASDPNVVPNDARQKVTDELGKSAYVAKNADQMRALAKQAEEENTALGRAGRLGYEPPSVHALRLLAMPLLHDEVGRPNEAAIEAFEHIIPKPFERASTAKANQQALEQFINNHKQAPTARSYGINPESYQSTTSNPVGRLDAQTKQYYDFATAHPNLPVSQDFFAKHPELKK